MIRGIHHAAAGSFFVWLMVMKWLTLNAINNEAAS
jgi:hypothetical protein